MLYNCHPKSFSRISELIQRCIDRNKAEASITVFIDDIFIPHESDDMAVSYYKRLSLVNKYRKKRKNPEWKYAKHFRI